MTSIKKKYLDQLSEDYQLLSEIVLSQIIATKRLLNSGNESNQDLFNEIERNENLIDGLDIKIKEEVISAIFLFMPRAADLRKVVAYHDMTVHLERIGDLTLNVVHSIKDVDLDMQDFEKFKEILLKMLKYAEKMTNNAVLAFTYDDSQLAYETIDRDTKVDALFWKISEKLSEVFKDRSLSQQELKNIMGISSISSNIERIADHATDIAESAVYFAEGKDIRHKQENNSE